METTPDLSNSQGVGAAGPSRLTNTSYAAGGIARAPAMDRRHPDRRAVKTLLDAQTRAFVVAVLGRMLINVSASPETAAVSAGPAPRRHT
jgi:hypothetical protein